MALKSKITKAEFDALADAIKAEYKVGANADTYLLDTDEATELRGARDRANQERDEAKAEAARLKKISDDAEKARLDAVAESDREKARKAGDTTALENSYKTKLDEQKTAHETEVATLRKQIDDLLVKGIADAMAAEISTVPELLAPQIAARLKSETTGEKAITRVLDAAGQPSAATIDDLKKEFVANQKYAGIIKGTSGSGGGANGGGNGGGAPSGKKFSQLTETERVALHRADAAKFKDLSERHQRGDDALVS